MVDRLRITARAALKRWLDFSLIRLHRPKSRVFLSVRKSSRIERSFFLYKTFIPPLPLTKLLQSVHNNHITVQTLSLPRNLTAWPYFCNLVIKPSPCLTTSVYCLFLSSGRFVSMILFTRSMVQGIRSAAMNLERSLLCVNIHVSVYRI